MPAIILIVLGVWGWNYFSGDSVSETQYTSTNSSYSYPNSNSGYYRNSYTSDNERAEEPENPYDEGSGHSAGYEWAQENDPNDCGGNSQSFVEGCQEYLDEKEEYESSQN